MSCCRPQQPKERAGHLCSLKCWILENGRRCLRKEFVLAHVPVLHACPLTLLTWHALGVQLEDRFSPSWWFADVPSTAIIPLRKIDAVLPYLRQVSSSLSSVGTLAFDSNTAMVVTGSLCARLAHFLCFVSQYFTTLQLQTQAALTLSPSVRG